MEAWITEYITEFAEYSKEYPAIAAVFGLWALGTITWIFKSLPKKLWSIFIRNVTTTLTIVNTNQSFYLFLKWYEENNFSHNSRSIKISNGQYGYNEMVKAMGYGNHYFIFNRMPIKLNLSQNEATGTHKERDQIEMTIPGRSHKTFDKIFESIKNKDLDKNKVIIHKFHNTWDRASEQRTRSFDTIYLNSGIKEKIINFVDDFRDREKFNLKYGINHQTAMILYGPPGTGKTSIIKAIASHFDMNIYNLNTSALSKIEDAFALVPENALVVIEDIDSDNILHHRDEESDNSKAIISNLLFSSMSDVLNAIDGLHCSHGRILVATTNHIEKLDGALLRNGRFDLKIKIDYADNSVVKQFIQKFYPNKTLPKSFGLRKNISSSDIQNSMLINIDSFENFISELCGELANQRKEA